MTESPVWKKQRIKGPTRAFIDFLPPAVSVPAASKFTFTQQLKPLFEDSRTEQPKESNAHATTAKDATAKAAKPRKDSDYSKNPTIPYTKAYWRALREYNQFHGTRRWAQFLVVLGEEPHVLLFRRSIESLGDFIPGGALNYDEDEDEGLKRIWCQLFHGDGDKVDADEEMEVIGCVSIWYRPDTKENVYPYKSKYIKEHKEVIKTYVVQLKKSVDIKFPYGIKECVPCDLFDLYDRKDPQLASIPLQLSTFDFRK
jgi:hypothetical protein